MLTYLISLGAGVLVGIIYSLPLDPRFRGADGYVHIVVTLAAIEL